MTGYRKAGSLGEGLAQLKVISICKEIVFLTAPAGYFLGYDNDLLMKVYCPCICLCGVTLESSVGHCNLTMKGLTWGQVWSIFDSV